MGESHQTAGKRRCYTHHNKAEDFESRSATKFRVSQLFCWPRLQAHSFLANLRTPVNFMYASTCCRVGDQGYGSSAVLGSRD
jgi:hypothetical protein